MRCPSESCQSTNIQHLPLYWASLPSESPLRVRFAQPEEPDLRTRLILGAVAVLGLVVAVTGGGVALGLVMLAGGAAGVAFTTSRIGAAVAARELWQRQQICLSCTGLWVP